MANPSLSQLQSRITTASFVLAMQRARGVVKEELKRQRVRIADVEAKEITERAKDYLIAHPELVVETRPVIESWFARGVFGKRAQKEFIKQSTFHSHNVESAQSRLREAQ
jgi:hypothetical protein